MKYIQITISFIFLVLISLNSFAQSSSSIRGTVMGYNNEPMALAHVHLAPANVSFLTDKVIGQVEVNKDGSFTLAVEKPGSYTLHLTGVHHKRYTTPVSIDGINDIVIEANLGTSPQRPNKASYPISASSNNYNILGGMKANRSGNSEYTFQIPADSAPFKYQFAYGSPVAGISDTYELITSVRYGSDHYVAVIEDVREPYEVSVDITKFPPPNMEPEVSFGDEDQDKLAAIEQYISEEERNFVRARSTHLSSGKDMGSFTHDWSQVQDRLSKEFASFSDKEKKDMIVIYQLKLGLSGASIKEETAEYALENISPASSAWAIEPNAIFIATNKKGGIGKNQKYVDDMLSTNVNEEVVRTILFSLVRSTKRQENIEDHEYYYAKLVSLFPGSNEAIQAEQAFTFSRKIENGSVAPLFSIPSLENDSKRITNTDFKGKYYLIDVWATWCGPCIFEMDNLHEAYDLYKDDNFDILSISIDDFKNYVTDFRKQKWPMPWKNAHDKGGFRGETMKLFEVYGVPRALLINPQGEIVAMDSELRGENLKLTLDKFLNK